MKNRNSLTALLLSAALSFSGGVSAGYSMVIGHKGAGGPLGSLSNPQIFGITPSSLPLTGGSVSLVGAEFALGSVVAVDDAPATVSFSDETNIIFDAPAHAAGSVDVLVTNPDGQTVLETGGLTYVAPPAISSIDPAIGTPEGGTSVSISGADLSPDTQVSFGGVPAGTITFNDSTSLTVTTPAAAPGIVDVVVSNEFGINELTGGFDYGNLPAIASLSITAAPTTGGQFVTITGLHFNSQTKIQFDGVDTVSTYVDETTISAMVPAHAPGNVTVSAYNQYGEAFYAPGFDYGVTPVLTSLAPVVGSTDGGDVVVVTGENFNDSTWFKFGGTDAPAVTVDSETQLTVTTPSYTPELVGVTVYNEFGSNWHEDAFEFIAPPAFTSVTPASGSTLGGDLVVITGTGFTADSTVEFGGVAVASMTYVNSGNLTVVTPVHAEGWADVTVSNAYGAGTKTDGYYFKPRPVVTNVSPATGSTAGGETVTISGSYFATSWNEVYFDGVRAQSETTINNSTIEAVVPAGSAGGVDIRIVNWATEGTTANKYTYVEGPIITSLNGETGGPTAGGDAVTISGANFTPDTTVTFGSVTADDITYVNATTMTVTAPAYASQGSVDVRVTNAYGTNALAAAYYYKLPPVMTSISPATGSIDGGDVVVITGSGFANTNWVYFDGVAAPSVVVNSGKTQLTVTTPAGVAGSADVRIYHWAGENTYPNAFTYEAPQPLVVSLTLSGANAISNSWFQQLEATKSLSVTGGVAPYTFQWEHVQYKNASGSWTNVTTSGTNHVRACFYPVEWPGNTLANDCQRFSEVKPDGTAPGEGRNPIIGSYTYYNAWNADPKRWVEGGPGTCHKIRVHVTDSAGTTATSATRQYCMEMY